MLPLGLGLAAAVPAYRVGLMHVFFVGGLSLMAFGVATHVIAAHGGHLDVVLGRPWQVAVFGVLFLLAMSTRVSADLVPGSYFLHLGGAAALWLLALFAWALLLVPRLFAPPAGEEAPPPVVTLDPPRR
jgi:hypothetical protein